MLSDNIKKVRQRIAQAAMKAGRSSNDVRLIAVTKQVDAEAIREAVHLGLTEFGESRVQAAAGKISNPGSEIFDTGITWHLIGHLQKNKVKTAVELFDLIHSVDSEELAELLDKHAGRAGKTQKILLQVKLSDEVSKYGISKCNIMKMLETIGDFKNLEIEGLMAIPPYFEDPEMARPYFRELRHFKEEAEKAGFHLQELSMGMSNDFEVAIEEGATMVRVGTAIFGERKKEAR